ncbi:MAG TPA: UDP-N-acetylmuramoyl-L-alanyl-D-glutamate--2,6-diaminopimelate ligase [Actinomycetota bacterium]|nr:UDP-N-acetylmuramoyl-L-alanyl-D-glutamate--2,6-diaminopimelate ligase [Actinomycetota bacterium]
MDHLPPVPLSSLAAPVRGARVRGDAGTLVRGATFDSRRVRSGSLFFCVPGSSQDGHAFAGAAAAAGAAALVVERWLDLDVPQVLVPSVRAAMGPMSSIAHGDPSRALSIVGVTGTNGKTTVVHVVEAIARADGRRTGAIGTIGARINDDPVALTRTTPEAPDVQALLARMREARVTTVAMEVSSHALAQHRVDGVDFDVVAFTNLSQDHLDFHPSMEAYFEAKASLFRSERAARAVVNVDDAWGRRLLRADLPITTYSVDGAADVRAADVRSDVTGSTFTVDGRVFRTALRGSFNVSNCLAAIACARVLGIDPDAIERGVASVGEVPGRMEPVGAGPGPLVVVDYAHTPDSIRSVLAAARPLATGRVIVVFGCGGDRDRAKRSPMGRAATEGADLTVVTSDNPRSEDPLTIIAEIERGAAQGGGRFVVEPDRRTAIRLALSEARPGDVVVIAGKGHEPTQELAGGAIPFDDRVVARQELEALGARP